MTNSQNGAIIGSQLGGLVPGGGLLFGILGGAVGSILGGKIGQKLAGSNEQNRPGLGGVEVVTAHEGAPISMAWGGVDITGTGGDQAGLRLPGSVAWASDPYDVVTTFSSSKQGTPADYSVLVDAAVTFAGNFMPSLYHVVVDGEKIFETVTSVSFDVNVSASDTAPFTDVILDYESHQSFTTDLAGNVTAVGWILVIRSSASVDGVPNTTASSQLSAFKGGDEVTITLNPGLPSQQTSHVFGSPGVPKPWTVIYQNTNEAGYSELKLKLSPGNDGLGFYTNASGSPFVGLPPPVGGIDPSDYPVWESIWATAPQTNSTLRISAFRDPWKAGSFGLTVPAEGVDWEFHPGYDAGGDSPDASTTAASTIMSTSLVGGLGDLAPFHATRPTLYVKGFNLSPYGTRFPNMQLIGVAGLNASPGALVAELLGIAGIPQRLTRLRPRASWMSLWGQEIANGNPTAATSGFDAAVAGASSFRATISVGGPIFPGLFFSIGVNSLQTEEDEDEVIIYRVVHVEAIAASSDVRIYCWPRLDDLYDLAPMRFYGAAGPYVDGFVLSGKSDIETAITQVMLAYDLDIREAGGRLEVFRQTERDTVAVSPVHLDARVSGSAPSDALDIREPDVQEIPSRVDVSFRNVDNVALDGVESDQLDSVYSDVYGRGQNDTPLAPVKPGTSVVLSLPDVTLSRRSAHAIARRSLQRLNDESREARFSIPPWYQGAQEGDLIDIADLPVDYLPADGNVLLYGAKWTLLVDEFDLGNNGVMDCRAYVRSSDDQLPPPGTPRSTDGIVHQGGETWPNLFDLDIPPSLVAISPTGPTLVLNPGVWIVTTIGGPATPMGATLFQGFDDVDDFHPIRGTTGAAVFGNVTGTTALDAGANIANLDYASSINVKFHNGTPESVTELEALQGANFYSIGGELCCVITATLESDGSYTLTGFRRGMFSTGDKIAGHTDDGRDLVIWLGHINRPAPGVEFVEMNAGDVGRTLEHRAVTSGGDVDSASSVVTESVQLLSGRPHPAAYFSWDSVKTDIEFRWSRRPRTRWPVLYGTPPQLEKDDVWIIKFYKITTGVLLRTETTADGARSFTYTSAMMSTDGTASDDNVTVTIERQAQSGLNSLTRSVVADIADGPDYGGLDY